jgi:DNA-binding response OmpR family regulator
MQRILVIEDDPQDLQKLKNLLQDHYDVIPASNGRIGLRLAREESPDLIVLDWELPDISGDKICEVLRQEDNPARILILTGRRTEDLHEVWAFQMKADEYARKPYTGLVLLERIKKLLRQGAPATPVPDAVYFDDVMIDFRAYEARRAGVRVALSYKEFDVLRYLVARAGQVIERPELMAKVWAGGERSEPREVDNAVVKLRKVIERDPKNPQRLRTVYRKGYTFAKATDIFVTIQSQNICITDITS